jgi:hypothetical protein
VENLQVLKAEKGFHQFQGLHSGEREIVFYAETSSDWLHFEAIIREMIPFLKKPFQGSSPSL